MPHSTTLYVGMDVHKASIAVASGAPDQGAEVVFLGAIGTRQGDLAQLLRQLQANATTLVFVDEAGPGGDGLYRALAKTGQGGWVVAPSLLPHTAGARVTPARRDAIHLARLLRSGELTPISLPSVEEAAIRELRRARDEALRARKAAKVRLTAWRRRHDLRYPGRAPWGPAPLRGLSAVIWATPAPHLVFQDYGRAVTAPTARLERLDQARQEQPKPWRLLPVVAALQALRGVQCTVAVTIVAERGDLPRCATPRPLMRYVGVIPAAYSRGERRHQRSSPTAGNRHARRALIDGAWASRAPAKGRRHRQLRLEPRPHSIQDIRGKAQGRLGKRARNLTARGHHAHLVVVAMARALRAFLWAMAQVVPPSA